MASSSQRPSLLCPTNDAMKQRQRDWKENLRAQLGTPEGEARLAQLTPDEARELLREWIQTPPPREFRLRSVLALLGGLAALALVCSLTVSNLPREIIAFLFGSVAFCVLIYRMLNNEGVQLGNPRRRLLEILRRLALEPRETQDLSTLLFLAHHSPLDPPALVDRELWDALTLRLSMITQAEAQQLTQEERDFLVLRLNALRGVECLESQERFVIAALFTLAASGDRRARVQAHAYRFTTSSPEVKEAADDILR